MIDREASATLKALAKTFKAVALTGPRQSGKTTLSKTHFPDKPYVTLENPDERSLAISDPYGFLSRFPNGAILDEVQRTPELFSYLQQILDDRPEKGQFILTGSNNFLLLESISQSLAGRVGYLDLLPFSLSEVEISPLPPGHIDELIFYGGYPAVIHDKANPELWFPSYVRSYVERDVRQIKNISDLNVFQRFLYLCAGRVGQQLNLSNLANEVGVDYKTIQSWIGILQASYILYLLPPYYRNYNKRIVKTPKLYFYDCGLICYLLGIKEVTQLSNHASRGALFENYIISELMKNRMNKSQRPNLFYFRDSTGNEIDVLIDEGSVQIPIEIKSGATINPDYFKGLNYWEDLTNQHGGMLIYGGDKSRIDYHHFKINNWRDVKNI